MLSLPTRSLSELPPPGQATILACLCARVAEQNLRLFEESLEIFEEHLAALLAK